MTVVVSGATLVAMPMPSTSTAGRTVLRYEPPIPGRRKQCETESRDERANGQRAARAVAIDQAARPSRHHEHQDDERQERGAGLGRRVTLHLDEIQRKEEQEPGERGVEKKREQVGARERPRAEERERKHRRRGTRFDEEKGKQQDNPRDGSQRTRIQSTRTPARRARRSSARRPPNRAVRTRQGCATRERARSRLRAR